MVEGRTVKDPVSCPRCGAPLDAAASLHGFCPCCLLGQGIEPDERDGSSAADATAVPSSLPTRAEHPTQLGPYRVLGVLGEGGMGIVYLAQQESPVRRRVAVKLIKLGMDTSQVLARFESERQTLAILNHPGIAKVYDAGVTERGRPYFVMEQVAGIPITDYCDRNRLDLRDRLGVFIQVCHGVHHAHQKGIIHRDIKPSNVLVALEDGRPAPKIIDFGVAKATDRHLTERTLFTEHGVLIGTPEYMSPEQTDVCGLDIDTATDVYSLGVLLYELLAGVLPFDARRLREAGDDELRRIIRTEDPPRPSERVQQRSAGGGPDATSAEAAAARRTDPGMLRRQLRGDLDWITMRALEKDRTRRYASASEFAADVRRFLDDEPVLAGPPSALYRLRKLVQRKRGPVTAAAAIVLLLVGGLTGSSALYVRSERARREAVRQTYVANLLAAEASLRTGEMREAKRRLLACDPALRSWEWRHLYARTDDSVAVIDGGGAPDWSYNIVKRESPMSSRSWSVSVSPATSAAWSSDGSRILWLTRDSLRQADARTLRPLDSTGRPLPSGAPRKDEPAWMVPSPLAYTADGSRVLWKTSVPRKLPDGVREEALNRNYTLYLQDATTGGFVAALPGLESEAMSADFGPEGRTIAAGTIEGTILVWDAASGSVLRTIVGRRNPVTQVAVSRDGALVASCSEGEPVRIHSLATGEVERDYGPESSSTGSLAFDPEGRRIGAGGADGAVRVWPTVGGGSKIPVVFAGHTGGVSSVAFSPDGARIATGGVDKTVRVWDSASGASLSAQRGHDGSVQSVGFNVDGRRLVSSSSDNTLRVWDVQPELSGNAAVRTLTDHNGPVRSVSFSADGARLAAAGWGDDAVRVWDVASGRELARLPIPARIVGLSAAFSPRQPWIAAAGIGMPIHLWDAVSHQEVRQIHMRGCDTCIDLILGFAFSPDGSRIVCALGDKTMALVDAVSGAPVVTFPKQKEPASSVSYGPDGRCLASGHRDGMLRLWDTEKGGLIAEWPGHDNAVMSVAISPDGRRLVSASADGSVKSWDAWTQSLAGVLRGHDAKVMSLVFSPDGSRIVGASQDGTLRIWDALSFDLVLTLRGHEAGVLSVAFSPDGSRIASGSSDRTVRVWSTRAPRL